MLCILASAHVSFTFLYVVSKSPNLVYQNFCCYQDMLEYGGGKLVKARHQSVVLILRITNTGPPRFTPRK